MPITPTTTVSFTTFCSANAPSELSQKRITKGLASPNSPIARFTKHSSFDRSISALIASYSFAAPETASFPVFVSVFGKENIASKKIWKMVFLSQWFKNALATEEACQSLNAKLDPLSDLKITTNTVCNLPKEEIQALFTRAKQLQLENLSDILSYALIALKRFDELPDTSSDILGRAIDKRHLNGIQVMLENGFIEKVEDFGYQLHSYVEKILPTDASIAIFDSLVTCERFLTLDAIWISAIIAASHSSYSFLKATLNSKHFRSRFTVLSKDYKGLLLQIDKAIILANQRKEPECAKAWKQLRKP